MRTLLQFLYRYGHVLLFLLMEAIGLVFLIQGNDYQHSVAFTSAGKINGRLYAWRENVVSYGRLREKNRILWEENSALQSRVAQLESCLNDYHIQEQALKPALDFEFIHARVIKNSVSMLSNSFTLDVGTEDGVEKGMGVVDPQGVVGIVMACSQHYSVAMSVLSVNSRISCYVQHTNIVGTLTWQGGDTHKALLKEMPGYRMWQLGDTVLTSGFSSAFPRDIPIGIITGTEKVEGDSFYSASVALFPCFETLDNVRLLRRIHHDEQQALEKEALL